MRPWIVRIVATLLVPCLIADPVTASAFSNPRLLPLSAVPAVRWNEEALTLALVGFLHPISIPDTLSVYQAAAFEMPDATTLWLSLGVSAVAMALSKKSKKIAIQKPRRFLQNLKEDWKKGWGYEKPSLHWMATLGFVAVSLAAVYNLSDYPSESFRNQGLTGRVSLLFHQWAEASFRSTADLYLQRLWHYILVPFFELTAATLVWRLRPQGHYLFQAFLNGAFSALMVWTWVRPLSDLLLIAQGFPAQYETSYGYMVWQRFFGFVSYENSLGQVAFSFSHILRYALLFGVFAGCVLIVTEGLVHWVYWSGDALQRAYRRLRHIPSDQELEFQRRQDEQARRAAARAQREAARAAREEDLRLRAYIQSQIDRDHSRAQKAEALEHAAEVHQNEDVALQDVEKRKQDLARKAHERHEARELRRQEQERQRAQREAEEAAQREARRQHKKLQADLLTEAAKAFENGLPEAALALLEQAEPSEAATELRQAIARAEMARAQELLELHTARNSYRHLSVRVQSLPELMARRLVTWKGALGSLDTRLEARNELLQEKKRQQEIRDAIQRLAQEGHYLSALENIARTEGIEGLEELRLHVLEIYAAALAANRSQAITDINTLLPKSTVITKPTTELEYFSEWVLIRLLADYSPSEAKKALESMQSPADFLARVAMKSFFPTMSFENRMKLALIFYTGKRRYVLLAKLEAVVLPYLENTLSPAQQTELIKAFEDKKAYSEPFLLRRVEEILKSDPIFGESPLGRPRFSSVPSWPDARLLERKLTEIDRLARQLKTRPQQRLWKKMGMADALSNLVIRRYAVGLPMGLILRELAEERMRGDRTVEAMRSQLWTFLSTPIPKFKAEDYRAQIEDPYSLLSHRSVESARSPWTKSRTARKRNGESKRSLRGGQWEDGMFPNPILGESPVGRLRYRTPLEPETGIRLRRVAAQLTLEELVSASGISRRQILALEAGLQNDRLRQKIDGTITKLQGAWLKKRRSMGRLRMEDVARASHTDFFQFSEIENGATTASPEMIRRIHQVLTLLQGERLRKLRIAGQITVENLARQARISVRTLNLIEQGRTQAAPETIAELYRAIQSLQGAWIAERRKSGQVRVNDLASAVDLSSQKLKRIERGVLATEPEVIDSIHLAITQLQGAILKKRRLAARIEKQRLSHAMGISTDNLNEIEVGRSASTPDRIRQAHLQLTLLQRRYLSERLIAAELEPPQIATYTGYSLNLIRRILGGHPTDQFSFATLEKIHEAVDILQAQWLQKRREAGRISRKALGAEINRSVDGIRKIEKGLKGLNPIGAVQWHRAITRLQAHALRTLRMGLHQQHQQMAQVLKVHPVTYWRMESGRRGIPLDILGRAFEFKKLMRPSLYLREHGQIIAENSVGYKHTSSIRLAEQAEERLNDQHEEEEKAHRQMHQVLSLAQQITDPHIKEVIELTLQGKRPDEISDHYYVRHRLPLSVVEINRMLAEGTAELVKMVRKTPKALLLTFALMLLDRFSGLGMTDSASAAALSLLIPIRLKLQPATTPPSQRLRAAA